MAGSFAEFALIIQEVFDDPSLEIQRSTTVDDIAGWDSFSQAVLLLTINNRFKICLPADTEFDNVGNLFDRIIDLTKKQNSSAVASAAK